MIAMKPKADNVIIEFTRYGRYVKVTAIDCITHEEVSMIGDARHTQTHLKNMAVKKLRHVQRSR